MTNSQTLFARKGEPWDVRRERRDPIFQAGNELFDRTERYTRGYDAGRLKRARFKRDPVPEPREPVLNLKIVELGAWKGATHQAAGVNHGAGHALVRQLPRPKEELPVDTDWEDECARQARQWREEIARERAEMELRRARASKRA